MSLWKRLGPGIVAGASDNDPTTVATVSVIGATTVYGLSWLVILVIPMLVVVQVISAALGTVTKSGLQVAIRLRYGLLIAWISLIAVVGVTIFTLGADLDAAGAALELITGLNRRFFDVPIAILVIALLIFTKYKNVEWALRILATVFFAYIASTFFAHPNWHDVLRSTLVPHFTYSREYVEGAIALLGTMLTSYAYVWEAEEAAKENAPASDEPAVQADAAIGMGFTGTIVWFIVIATGATLGVHHKDVQTAQDAAVALTPVAGHFASLLFGIGLLGSALLAVPVLAGTTAYICAGTFGWRADLDRSFSEARPFYLTIVASVALGTLVAYSGVPPIKLLFISSIIGGLATPVTLILLTLMARDPKMMGDHCIGRTLAVAAWCVTAIVVVASIMFILQSLHIFRV